MAQARMRPHVGHEEDVAGLLLARVAARVRARVRVWAKARARARARPRARARARVRDRDRDRDRDRVRVRVTLSRSLTSGLTRTCSHEKSVSASYGHGAEAVASAGCMRECVASEGACSSQVLAPRTSTSTSAWPARIGRPPPLGVRVMSTRSGRIAVISGSR